MESVDTLRERDDRLWTVLSVRVDLRHLARAWPKEFPRSALCSEQQIGPTRKNRCPSRSGLRLIPAVRRKASAVPPRDVG